MMVNTRGPVRKIQPAANPVYCQMNTLKKTADMTPDELADLYPVGMKIFFTQPLQRRTDPRDRLGRFYWEPSGGANNDLFIGTVTGVRSYSCGHNDESYGYVPDQHFPVLLITYSPFRNPVAVQPWSTFETFDVYAYWRDQAIKNQAKVRALLR